MKWIEKTSEKIIKGLWISLIIFILGYLITIISLNSNAISELGHYISRLLFWTGTILKSLSAIYAFKFLCYALYKILKKIE